MAGVSDFYAWLDAQLGGGLPGGVAGRLPSGGTAFSPATGLGGSPAGLPAITTTPEAYQGLRAPRGYVLVEIDGRKIAMLAKVAYALGLKKRPQSGGGITRREMQAAAKVQRTIMSLTVKRQPRVPIKTGRKGK